MAESKRGERMTWEEALVMWLFVLGAFVLGVIVGGYVKGPKAKEVKP